MARKTDIRLRRSSEAGKIPTAENLNLGELALNTADGALYFKKGDGTVITAHDNTIMHIDSDNNRVGVNTTTPKEAFSVGNSINFHNGGHKLIAFGWNPSDSNKATANGYPGNIRYEPATGNIKIETDGVERSAGDVSNPSPRVTITKSGNVGIGLTEPTQKLHVNGHQLFENNNELRWKDSNDTERTTLWMDTNNNVNVGASSNAELRFINGPTYSAKMIIDVDGKVGIGTGSPSSLLHVLSSGLNEAQIIIESDATNDNSYENSNPSLILKQDGKLITGEIRLLGDDEDITNFGDHTNSLVIEAKSNASGTANSAGNIQLVTGGIAEGAVIDGVDGPTHGNVRVHVNRTGEVGIGTADPDRGLHLYGTGDTVAVKAEASDSSQASLDLKNSNSWFRAIAESGQFRIYDQSDSEDRLVIDTDGNLLVGKTSANSLAEGFEARASGLTLMTKDGGSAANFKRKTSDGNIVVFEKDQTTVGSIGVQNGANLLIGSGDTGIRFASSNNAIHPWNPTTLGLRDAAIDLGADTIRFKDLYLAGDLKIDGNVEANNVAKRVASTAVGGSGTSDGDGTWAKLVTYSMDPATSHTDGTFTYAIQGEENSKPDAALFTVTIRWHSQVDGASPSIEFNWISLSNGIQLSEDSFKLICDGGRGDDVELWMQKDSNYGNFKLWELAYNKEPLFDITYEIDSPWQSAEPTATGTDAINLRSGPLAFDGKNVIIGDNYNNDTTILTTGQIRAGSLTGQSAMLNPNGSLELCRTEGNADPFIDFKDAHADDYDARIQLVNGQGLKFHVGGNGNSVNGLKLNGDQTLEVFGTLKAPSTFTIDPSTHGDDTGTVVIAGDLQVDGTTTTINSTELVVDDKLITLASGSADKAAANGAGIEIDVGASDHPTLKYIGASTSNRWEFNRNLHVGNGSSAKSIRAYYSDADDWTGLNGWGLEFNREASYIRPSADATKDLYIGGADKSKDWRNISVRSVNGTTFTRQIDADQYYYPITLQGIDDGNTVDQTANSGIGIRFKLAGNTSADGGDALTGASIVATRQNVSDPNSSTGLAFHVSNNDATLDEAMRINESGFVGIGDNDPQHKLDIVGTARIQNASPSLILQDTSDDDDHSIKFVDNGNTVRHQIDTYGDNLNLTTFDATRDIILVPNETEIFRVAADGYVGINNQDPAYALHIKESTNVALMLETTHADGNSRMLFKPKDVGGWNIGANDNGNFTLYDVDGGYNVFNVETGAASNTFVLDSSSKIGIGTDAPDEKLHVEGNLLLDVYNHDGEEGGIFFREGFSNASKYNTSITLYDHNGSTDPDGLSINGFDGISFCTNSNTRQERMRIAQNGTVGIGHASLGSKLSIRGTVSNSSVNSTSASLHLDDSSNTAAEVGGSIVFTGAYTANNESLSAGPYIKAYKMNANDGDYGFGLKFATRQNDVGYQAVAMTIDSEQNVGIGTTSPAQIFTVENNSGIFRVNTSTSTYPRIELGSTSGTTAAIINRTTASQNIIFGETTDTGEYIFRGGNVGIGVSDPVAKLDVAGQEAYTGTGAYTYQYASGDGIRVKGKEAAIDIVGSDEGEHGASLLLRQGNAGFGFFTDPSTDKLHLRSYAATANNFSIHSTGGSVTALNNVLTMENTGNVGIGVGDPKQKLHVNGSARLGTNPSLEWEGNHLILQTVSDETIGVVNIYGTATHAPRLDIFSDAGTTKKINIAANGDTWFNGGDFAIGHTAPAAKLDVAGTIAYKGLQGRGGKGTNVADFTKYTWTENNSSSNGATWHKAGVITLPDNAYSGLSLLVETVYPGSNHGAYDQAGYIWFNKVSVQRNGSTGGTVELDTGSVQGPESSRIRLHRNNVGEWELQVRAAVDNNAVYFNITKLSSAGSAQFAIQQGNVAGSTGGTTITSPHTFGSNADNQLTHTFGQLQTSGRIKANGTIIAEGVGTYDPEGDGLNSNDGADNTDTAAIAIPRGKRIVGTYDGYIRNLINWTYDYGTSRADLTIGQTGTALINNINLHSGHTGHVVVRNSRGADANQVNNYAKIVIKDGWNSTTGSQTAWTANQVVSAIEFDSSDSSGNSGSADEPRATMSLVAETTDASATALTFGTKGNVSTAPTEKLRITSDGKVGIGTGDPSTALHIRQFTDTTQSSTGTTLLTLENDVGANAAAPRDLTEQKTFIDFTFKDDNSNETPQVQIGAEVGPNATADSALKEGHGNFVVYTNNSDSNDGASSPAERLRVDYRGHVGIGATAPSSLLHLKHAGDYNITFENSAGDGETFQLRHGNSGLYFTGPGSSNAVYGVTQDSDVVIYDTSNNKYVTFKGSDGRVGIGTTGPKTKLQVEAYGIETTSTDTSATTEVGIATFKKAEFRSAKFMVQATNADDSTYMVTEILLIHDGTTPSITEYGTIFTGSAAEATFDADISGDFVRLLATPASTDDITFRVVSHQILL